MRVAKEFQGLLKTILVEGRAFIDWHHCPDDSRSLWWQVLCWIYGNDSPITTLSTVLDLGLGSEFAVKDQYGWNSLFFFVLHAHPEQPGEILEVTQALLGVVNNVFAQDCDGLTLFEHTKFDTCKQKTPFADKYVDFEDMYCRTSRYLPDVWYDYLPEIQGSYQQDLWYCALLRSGRYSSCELPRLPPTPYFTIEYTPQHYRALLYLKSWDMDADPSISELPLISQGPSSAEEREFAPSFPEWNLSDLLMMEKRLEHARYWRRVLGVNPEDDWSSELDEDFQYLTNEEMDNLIVGGQENSRNDLSDGLFEEHSQLDPKHRWSDDSVRVRELSSEDEELNGSVDKDSQDLKSDSSDEAMAEDQEDTRNGQSEGSVEDGSELGLEDEWSDDPNEEEETPLPKTTPVPRKATSKLPARRPLAAVGMGLLYLKWWDSNGEDDID